MINTPEHTLRRKILATVFFVLVVAILVILARFILTPKEVKCFDCEPTLPADTQTYRNESLNMEFKYPKDWIVIDDREKSGAILVNPSLAPESNWGCTPNCSYVAIYPEGKPGSGMPMFDFKQQQLPHGPATIVQTEDGLITMSFFKFENAPAQNVNTEIFAGVKVDYAVTKCVSRETQQPLPSNACFSGAVEPGQEMGYLRISGSLNQNHRESVELILKSFRFIEE